jgi:hypothetical protein
MLGDELRTTTRDRPLVAGPVISSSFACYLVTVNLVLLIADPPSVTTLITPVVLPEATLALICVAEM